MDQDGHDQVMAKLPVPVIVLVPTVPPETFFQVIVTGWRLSAVKPPLPLVGSQLVVPGTFDHVTVPCVIVGWPPDRQPVSTDGDAEFVASVDPEVILIPGLNSVEPAKPVHAI
jgi:hypothetical protein